MGRYAAAVCRLCRREGEKLFLKGEKCYTEKCPFGKRSYAPGQHGKLPVRISEYKVRLREKQKARRIYGLTERQFEKYFDEAARETGITGEKLLEFLERRLDNVVYRLGFAGSRKGARQIVRHGGILVNGKRINIPAYRVKAGDGIHVTEGIKKLVKLNQEKMADYQPPSWLGITGEGQGKVVAAPRREEIGTQLSEQMIVEYYSR